MSSGRRSRGSGRAARWARSGRGRRAAVGQLGAVRIPGRARCTSRRAATSGAGWRACPRAAARTDLSIWMTALVSPVLWSSDDRDDLSDAHPGDPHVGLLRELNGVVELDARSGSPRAANGTEPPKEIHRNRSSPMHEAANRTMVRILAGLGACLFTANTRGQYLPPILLQSDGALSRSSIGFSARLGLRASPRRGSAPRRSP